MTTYTAEQIRLHIKNLGNVKPYLRMTIEMLRQGAAAVERVAELEKVLQTLHDHCVDVNKFNGDLPDEIWLPITKALAQGKST